MIPRVNCREAVSVWETGRSFWEASSIDPHGVSVGWLASVLGADVPRSFKVAVFIAAAVYVGHLLKIF